MAFHHLRRIGAVAGGVIMVAGILLLLRVSDFWLFWPLIPVVLGLASLTQSLTPSTLIWGGLAAAVGALFFLDNLNLVPVDFSYVWPMLVVAFGITMLWKAQDASRSS
jgi:hypothetical protein